MVDISLSGSGEGPGWVTAPGYSTAPWGGLSPERSAWGCCPGDGRQRKPLPPVGGGNAH